MELVISVIGAGTADDRLVSSAEQVGALLAQREVTLVCGGLGGVMEAACRGARRHAGRTIGILPGVDRAGANRYVDLAIATGMGEARNVLVVRAAMAIIAIGGGFGTLSELAFARKLDVPVVGLHTWQFADDGITHVADPGHAVRLAVDICRTAA